MSNLMISMIVFGLMALSGCGDEHTAATQSQRDQVAEKAKEWSQFKEELGGNYQMRYRNTDVFSVNTISEYFVEVRGGVISTSEVVTGQFTMDDLYALALETIDDPNCSVSISFYSEKPVIRTYSSQCFSETAGIEVTDFY